MGDGAGPSEHQREREGGESESPRRRVGPEPPGPEHTLLANPGRRGQRSGLRKVSLVLFCLLSEEKPGSGRVWRTDRTRRRSSGVTGLKKNKPI